MSEEQQNKRDNKNILIFAAVVAVALLIGGTVYMQQKSEKSVSVNVGGKEISASFSE